jgi:menaquinol-cytochrome c reductase iron-sulfur subunit
VGYILSPAGGSERRREWRPLGAPEKVEVGVPTLFKTRIERTSGWVTQEEEISVYVLTEDGRNYEGLSNVCTHLGCRVRWVGDQESFFCPCHNASFAKNGDVATGPPPRPLDKFEVMVENGQLLVNLEV